MLIDIFSVYFVSCNTRLLCDDLLSAFSAFFHQGYISCIIYFYRNICFRLLNLNTDVKVNIWIKDEVNFNWLHFWQLRFFKRKYFVNFRLNSIARFSIIVILEYQHDKLERHAFLTYKIFVCTVLTDINVILTVFTSCQ